MTDLKFPVENFETIEEVEDNSTNKVVVLKGVNMVAFMKEVWNDEHVGEFLSNPDILEMFARRIGVDGLFRTYQKEDVCNHLGWEYIKEYFLDHVEASDILDHLGWEVVSKHFADYLDGHETSAEDINSIGSVAEKLNACKGQD